MTPQVQHLLSYHPKIAIASIIANKRHLAMLKLTTAETLQSDDEGIVLTSCSLSTSHTIIDGISPDAYWYCINVTWNTIKNH